MARCRADHCAGDRPCYRPRQTRSQSRRHSMLSTCLGWAEAACARKSLAIGVRRHGAATRELIVLDTTDERTIATAAPPRASKRRCSWSPARAAARLKLHRWNGFSGRHARAHTGRRAGRHFVAITDPGRRCRSSRSSAGIARSLSIPPTSAAASPHCRCSGWCPRR